jgi:hypothetical protein
MERIASLPELGQIHNHRDAPDAYITSIRSGLRKTEKDEFGEVFTPPAIINAMLDRIPPHLWHDPAKKWLDPAAGFGNFPMIVYARLMTGLATHPDYIDKDPAERSRHIIRHMLYMVEFNPESCTRIREIFGSSANLSYSSFLDPFGPTTFTDGTTQFDVIVGNPPFNADQSHEGKKGGGSNLWPKFVEKSLCNKEGALLREEGYLLFVHPALWRKPPSERSVVSTLFNKMTRDNHMIYLDIHSKLDGKRDFGVQTRYDFYLIQKRRPTLGSDFTIVKDQEGYIHQLDLSLWRFFLPNHSFELIQPLLTEQEQEQEQEQCYVIFSRSQFGSDKKTQVQSTEDETHKFQLIHSTPIDGPRIYWSSTRDDQPFVPMFGVPKVIFGESGINDVILDEEGKYGMTQGAIGLKIPVPRVREGALMKKALESTVFNRILDAMSFSNFRIDWRMFLYFRPDFYKDILDNAKFQRTGRGKNRKAVVSI